MYCYKCGYKNSDNARFCVKCGTAMKVDNTDAQRANNRIEPDYDDYYEEDDYQVQPERRQGKGQGSRSYPKRKKGPNKALLIFLIIVVAAAAAAAIIFLLRGSKTTINLNNYLNASIEGTNGEGSVSAELDVDSIISDYPSAFTLDNEKKKQIIYAAIGTNSSTVGAVGTILDSLGLSNITDAAGSLSDAAVSLYPDDQCIKLLFGACISGSFDRSEGLSNGDTITYSWSVDEEKFQEIFDVTFSAESLEYKIAGLTENSSADASSSEAAKDAENDQDKSSSDSSNAESKTDSDTMNIPTVTATPTPAVNVAATVMTASSTSMNGYSKLSISSATSSVECLKQEGAENSGIDNSAKSAVDGNEVTSWQEGVDGYGIGAYLDLKLSGTASVHAISFKMGNWRDADQYRDNARPKGITIWLDNQSFSVTIPDGMTEYAVVFSSDVSASDIKVVIDSVYTADWEDTCISEITVYGK